MEPLGASTKRNVGSVMCGDSILSCCPRNPHGHERALKEEEPLFAIKVVKKQQQVPYN